MFGLEEFSMSSLFWKFCSVLHALPVMKDSQIAQLDLLALNHPSEECGSRLDYWFAFSGGMKEVTEHC